MPHKMSVVVTSILFTGIASASLADPTPNPRRDAVQTNMDYWQAMSAEENDSASALGQRISDRASAEGGATFTSFGDFLQIMAGNTR